MLSVCGPSMRQQQQECLCRWRCVSDPAAMSHASPRVLTTQPRQAINSQRALALQAAQAAPAGILCARLVQAARRAQVEPQQELPAAYAAKAGVCVGRTAQVWARALREQQLLWLLCVCVPILGVACSPCSVAAQPLHSDGTAASRSKARGTRGSKALLLPCPPGHADAVPAVPVVPSCLASMITRISEQLVLCVECRFYSSLQNSSRSGCTWSGVGGVGVGECNRAYRMRIAVYNQHTAPQFQPLSCTKLTLRAPTPPRHAQAPSAGVHSSHLHSD